MNSGFLDNSKAVDSRDLLDELLLKHLADANCYLQNVQFPEVEDLIPEVSSDLYFEGGREQCEHPLEQEH